MKIILAAFAILCMTTAAADAAKSDREKFQKFVGKQTGRFGKASKLPCLCKSGEYGLRAGSIVQQHINSQVFLECRIPTFHADGSFNFAEPCGDFVPLAK